MTRPKMAAPGVLEMYDAILAELRDIDTTPGSKMQVGENEAPKCPKPFLILSTGSSPQGSGPIDDTQSDARTRFQINAVGETARQAMWAIGKSRDVMIPSILNLRLTTSERRILTVTLDVAVPPPPKNAGSGETTHLTSDLYIVLSTPRITVL